MQTQQIFDSLRGWTPAGSLSACRLLKMGICKTRVSVIHLSGPKVETEQDKNRNPDKVTVKDHQNASQRKRMPAKVTKAQHAESRKVYPKNSFTNSSEFGCTMAAAIPAQKCSFRAFPRERLKCQFQSWKYVRV